MDSYHIKIDGRHSHIGLTVYDVLGECTTGWFTRGEVEALIAELESAVDGLGEPPR